MNSNRIDLVFEPTPGSASPPQEALLTVAGMKSQARLVYYPRSKGGAVLARADLSVPLDVRWRDAVDLSAPRGGGPIGRGRVLHPQAPKLGRVRMARRTPLLELLLGDDADMVQALALENGVGGLNEDDVRALTPLKPGRLERLGAELEARGRVKILSFSPLVLVSRDSLDLLGRKTVGLIARHHERRPDQGGLDLPALKKRLEAPVKILALTLKALTKSGDIVEDEGLYRLPGFSSPISPEEETILDELEALCLNGRFFSVSLDEIRSRFRLTPAKLRKLLDILVDRKRIIQGEDGFYLHARWLEEIIAKLRETRKRQLTVGDFKRMTGLTRKYAIPLLELLDGMGVTRRKGPSREIL